MKNILISLLVIASFISSPVLAKKKPQSKKTEEVIGATEIDENDVKKDDPDEIEAEAEADAKKDEVTEETPEAAPAERVGRRRKSRKRTSSEDNRTDKHFVAAAQLGGFGPVATVSNGGYVGFHLNGDSVLLLEFTNGEDIGFLTYDRTTTSSLGLHFKMFTSNSFYFKVGVDHRKVKYASGSLFAATVTHSFDGESLAATAAIGNQWQWSYFTLGCDWVGAVIPFKSEIKNSVATTTSSSFESDKDKFTKDTTYTFVRLYVGATF